MSKEDGLWEDLSDDEPSVTTFSIYSCISFLLAVLYPGTVAVC